MKLKSRNSQADENFTRAKYNPGILLPGEPVRFGETRVYASRFSGEVTWPSLRVLKARHLRFCTACTCVLCFARRQTHDYLKASRKERKRERRNAAKASGNGIEHSHRVCYSK